jgi:hypothetical protein
LNEVAIIAIASKTANAILTPASFVARESGAFAKKSLSNAFRAISLACKAGLN